MATINQGRNQVKYRTTQDLSRTFPVVLLCEIAGVSKAGFYKWLKREVPEREKENEYLISLMKREHEKRQGIYGYRSRKNITLIAMKHLQNLNDHMYFYNHERFQENLNNLTPMEYRSKAA